MEAQELNLSSLENDLKDRCANGDGEVGRGIAAILTKQYAADTQAIVEWWMKDCSLVMQVMIAGDNKYSAQLVLFSGGYDSFVAFDFEAVMTEYLDVMEDDNKTELKRILQKIIDKL